LLANFKPSGNSLVLAARLRGAVKSAFDQAPAPAEGAPPSAQTHLTQSNGAINVIVVADTDMLEDRFWVQVQEFFGQRVATPAAYNGDFVVNAVDNLLGSSDLIGLRGRGLSQRPFTLLAEIQREAEQRFRAKERELTEKLRETEKRLADLQGRGGPRSEDAARSILTADQQGEIDRFRAELLGVRRELRDVQLELRRDIEAVQTNAKVINIAAVPAAVAFAAILLAFVRARRRSA
jgi:ABC-type uncharacterized transport system involved in gliding motility auxiliary subunit